jgi:hypothetical protein
MSDVLKGAVIEASGYVAAGVAGASVGALVSKVDGAIQHNPGLWLTFEGAPSNPHTPANYNALAIGEVFGPMALGAVAMIALMRKIVN